MNFSLIALFDLPAPLFLFLALVVSVVGRRTAGRWRWGISGLQLFAFGYDGLSFAALPLGLGVGLIMSRSGLSATVLGGVVVFVSLAFGATIVRQLWIVHRYPPNYFAAYLATWGA